MTNTVKVVHPDDTRPSFVAVSKLNRLVKWYVLPNKTYYAIVVGFDGREGMVIYSPLLRKYGISIEAMTTLQNVFSTEKRFVKAMSEDIFAQNGDSLLRFIEGGVV